jgi:hypothetical protein
MARRYGPLALIGVLLGVLPGGFGQYGARIAKLKPYSLIRWANEHPTQLENVHVKPSWLRSA